jgi:hypothetical protein
VIAKRVISQRRLSRSSYFLLPGGLSLHQPARSVSLARRSKSPQQQTAVGVGLLGISSGAHSVHTPSRPSARRLRGCVRSIEGLTGQTLSTPLTAPRPDLPWLIAFRLLEPPIKADGQDFKVSIERRPISLGISIVCRAHRGP